MILLLIILVVVITISYGGVILLDRDTHREICLLICVVSSILLGGVFHSLDEARTPQAIDVYRGNTTLQITYRDSIPIDSVVVWKQ